MISDMLEVLQNHKMTDVANHMHFTQSYSCDKFLPVMISDWQPNTAVLRLFDNYIACGDYLFIYSPNKIYS